MLELLVCKIGDLKVGIENNKIMEIVERRSITELPVKSKVLKGIFNLRGNIIPFFDISGVFINTPLKENFNYFIIIESEKKKRGGIGIHEIVESMKVQEINSKIAPGKVREEIEKNFLKGVIGKKNDLIFVLDVDNLIEKEEVI